MTLARVSEGLRQSAATTWARLVMRPASGSATQVTVAIWSEERSQSQRMIRPG